MSLFFFLRYHILCRDCFFFIAIYIIQNYRRYVRHKIVFALEIKNVMFMKLDKIINQN